MCKGDEPIRAEFEARRLQFHDDVPAERCVSLSAFLAGDFPS
jgi:hypothetical protein